MEGCTIKRRVYRKAVISTNVMDVESTRILQQSFFGGYIRMLVEGFLGR
jgi:hypothetical protein